MSNIVSHFVDVLNEITDGETAGLKELEFWTVCRIINQSISAPFVKCILAHREPVLPVDVLHCFGRGQLHVFRHGTIPYFYSRTSGT
jgi:hypothetical protein